MGSGIQETVLMHGLGNHAPYVESEILIGVDLDPTTTVLPDVDLGSGLDRVHHCGIWAPSRMLSSCVIHEIFRLGQRQLHNPEPKWTNLEFKAHTRGHVLDNNNK